MHAMQVELKAHAGNEAWTLVTLRKDIRLIGFR